MWRIFGTKEFKEGVSGKLEVAGGIVVHGVQWYRVVEHRRGEHV